MFAAKCILNKEERGNKKHKFKKEEFASMYLILITEMGVSDEAKNVIPQSGDILYIRIKLSF
jgi:hypothetical protein